MRLSTLDECVQDALATREKLASQINSLLAEHSSSFALINAASESQQNLVATKRAVASGRKQLKAALKKRAEFTASLKARREAMMQGARAQEHANDYLGGAREKLQECREMLQKDGERLRGQRRRICEDLMHIYPIEPVRAVCDFCPNIFL
jgi:chromosome segregation ATPase